MQNRSRFLAISLVVFMSLGIFAVAGYAAEDPGMMAGKTAIMEGAKKMMEGNKMVMDIAAKKGVIYNDFTEADKMMTEGYAMVNKGAAMMTGGTMAEGKAMVGKGTKMMMDAQIMMTAAAEKKGISKECAAAFDTCGFGEYQMKKGAMTWFYGGAAGW